MEKIKLIIKKVFKSNKLLSRFFLYYKVLRSFGKIHFILFIIKDFFVQFRPSIKKSQVENIYEMINKISFKDLKYNGFLYNLDVHKIFYTEKKYLGNFPVDYSMILDNSLYSLRSKTENNYASQKNIMINAIDNYIDKTINHLKKSNYKNKNNLINCFNDMKKNECSHLFDALQRILFYNQIMWQTGHDLVGLSRLDCVLYKYYEADIKTGYINKSEAEQLIYNFLDILHEYYWLKSNTLLGDTGQVIVLGGLNLKDDYECNDLTYLFIDSIKKLHYPDPKVLLRVSKKMPKELMEKSLECINTGIGSPLFANDDIIIPLLKKYGYSFEDSYDYSVSACWEPLVPKKGVEENNIDSFVFMTPFNEMFEKENVDLFCSIDDILLKYKDYLSNYTRNVVNRLNMIQYEKDPYVSLFVSNCDKKGSDVTEDGSFYKYCGLTTVSLGNVVNSLLNINEFVFKNKEITLSELNSIRLNNYDGRSDVIKKLKDQSNRYGLDNQGIIDLSNIIMNMLCDSIKDLRINDCKIKVGFSAPSYIIYSVNEKASFDGRKNGEPFIVHISSDINGLPYTSIFNFASNLDYADCRINGNVIDFIVNPSFINNNFDKFVNFLLLSIDNGFFEMQMNVVSSKVLIEAKKDPSKYPNLIVRVWGFSAYFNDLPDSYKDVLIKRTIESEKQYE